MIKFIFKELKQPILVVIIFFGILFVAAYIMHQQDQIEYYKNRAAIKPEVIYLTKIDSTMVSNIQSKNDSLKTELFVANYKLARIKEYVKLSEKGGNHRFLAGWINRVLDKHDEF